MNESIKWCSMDEVAEHLGITRDTVLKLIKKEAMPASKVGGKWLFDIKKVDQWVEKNSYGKKKN